MRAGFRGTDKVLVLAGFIAPEVKWSSFARAWNVHLDASPSIKYLKMSEAARTRGQFHGWSVYLVQRS